MNIKKIEISRWTLFIIFGLSIFVKCLLFHLFCFNYVAVSSLWNAPHDFFSFYVAKLLPALSIASFVFIFKRKWWMIMASIIIDLWMVANFIYYRANDLFLDTETIMIVDNLNGFWSSIATYLNWKSLLFFVLTILLCVFLAFVNVKNERNWKHFGIATAISVILFLGDHFAGYSTYKTTTQVDYWKYSAFKVVWRMSSGNYFYDNWVRSQWVEAQTPLHFFPTFLYKQICDKYYKKEFSLAESEKNEISTYVNHHATDSNIVSQNLIIILGESFESWVLQMKDENAQEVTPNMNLFRKKENVLFIDKIRSQVRRGSSGDGQMIINTGLLPLESGAACMLYGDNVYPNFAHKFDSAIIINPVHAIWNQSITTYSYGYKNLDENFSSPNKSKWENDDQHVVRNSLKQCLSLPQPFGIMLITITTHTPFNCPTRPTLSFNSDLPDDIVNYLNCMHYADSCIGLFLNELDKLSLLDNTTLVITGDHTIFRSNLLAEIQPIAQKYNLPIPQGESFCPLIISSPTIKKHTEIDTLCYQMDIYPTILHCLGINDYYWKGFGVNLLDSTSLQNRKISEEEAFRLSNLIIRSNYFATENICQ